MLGWTSANGHARPVACCLSAAVFSRDDNRPSEPEPTHPLHVKGEFLMLTQFQTSKTGCPKRLLPHPYPFWAKLVSACFSEHLVKIGFSIFHRLGWNLTKASITPIRITPPSFPPEKLPGQCRGKYLRRERNRWKLDPESRELRACDGDSGIPPGTCGWLFSERKPKENAS